MTIAFGSPEAAEVVSKSKLVEAIRCIDWNKVREDCVALYEYYTAEDGTTFNARADVSIGTAEYSSFSGTMSDPELAKTVAVANLMLFVAKQVHP